MSLPYRRTNGKINHPLYWIWNSMHVRCYYPSHKFYRDYGGRGISVTRAFFDFHAFVDYIETILGPRRGRSLDRIDSNDHYTYGNLRWATPSEQLRNRRK